MNTEIKTLKEVFENTISVSIIAEEIISLDYKTNKTDILREINEKGFDCMPLNQEGIIKFKAIKKEGSIIISEISTDELISSSTSILESFRLLLVKKQLFLLEGNIINKIITISDLDKSPLRLWVYGLITILEMSLKEMIECQYTNDKWRMYLTKGRLSKADNLYSERKRRNIEISLISCLQITDLFSIISKSDDLNKMKIGTGNNEFKKLSKRITKLRDNISHANKLNENQSWDEILELTDFISKMIDII
jgi:hypothetical protein